MFKNCQSLTTCPNINLNNVSTVADRCYAHMFKGCKKLIKAPTDIQLQKAGSKQYYCLEMFKDCVSLTDPPKLPSLKLAFSCYSRMFDGCTSLKTTP